MQHTTDIRSLLPLVRELVDLAGSLPLPDAVASIRERAGIARGAAVDAVRYAVNMRAVRAHRCPLRGWTVARRVVR